MKALDNEEMRRAIDAVETLYWLGLIDEFVCQAYKDKIQERTGE